MNALLYFQNQQPQAWHNLEMIFNTAIRIQHFISLEEKKSKEKKCKHIPSIEHALVWISKIDEGLRNALMEALHKKLEIGIFWT